MPTDAAEWPGRSSERWIWSDPLDLALPLLPIPRELKPSPPESVHMNAPTSVVHRSQKCRQLTSINWRRDEGNVRQEGREREPGREVGRGRGIYLLYTCYNVAETLQAFMLSFKNRGGGLYYYSMAPFIWNVQNTHTKRQRWLGDHLGVQNEWMLTRRFPLAGTGREKSGHGGTRLWGRWKPLGHTLQRVGCLVCELYLIKLCFNLIQKHCLAFKKCDPKHK